MLVEIGALPPGIRVGLEVRDDGVHFVTFDKFGDIDQYVVHIDSEGMARVPCCQDQEVFITTGGNVGLSTKDRLRAMVDKEAQE